jgi:glycosyltransferase involved in cell wall biosynthesis
VLIDGKSLKDIYEEQLNILKNTDTRTPERDANRAMSKILRDSLTDGHSVVSVVRPNLAADGKVSFTHQEVKVDLDKLNKIERNEKHNAFRRALDYLRIYKIKPKYASNASRDERQSNYKNTADYKNMLASVEKKFIDTFNKNSLKTREKEDAKILENAQKGRKKEVERDRFLQAYPEISAVGENNELELHVAGFGTLEAFFTEQAQTYDNIYFYGRLKYDHTLSLENECDIMLAIYDPTIDNHRFAAPNKFYESLLLGKPVIMVRGTGMSEVVGENGVGELIEFSKEGFIDGVNRLLKRKEEWPLIGDRMKEIYRDQYCWDEMERRLIQTYTEIENEKDTDR